MDKLEKIGRAEAYFKKMGYALGFTSPKRGVDLIVFPREEGGKGGATAVFVACMETKRYFPLNPFGGTKTRMTRFEALSKGAKAWIDEVGWQGKVRYDSVTFNQDGALDHIENAGYDHGTKTISHTVCGSLVISSEK